MEDSSRSVAGQGEPVVAGQLAYSLKQLAPRLGDVSIGFLRLEITRGRLKPHRLGRRVVITAAEVERYLNADSDAR